MDFRGLVWKWVWKITFFGLKSRQDLENGATHPHQEFPEVLLPPPPPGVSTFYLSNSTERTDATKKKKKNEIIKLNSQRRLLQLKEGFFGLLLFWRFKKAIVYNCFRDLDLVGYVVEGRQSFGSAPWKIRKTNIILRIKCKNASTLLRRTNEKQIYNAKKNERFMDELIIYLLLLALTCTRIIELSLSFIQ